MTRIFSSYYGADAAPFAWATDGADKFNRDNDLYRLAQALEKHDHSSGRGLAVARIAANGIAETMLAALSVSTRTLQDGAVTTPKIGDLQVTDAKLAIAKMPLAGGVMTGNLQVIPTATPTAGYFYPGNTGSYYGDDGTNLVIYHVSGGLIYLLGNPITYRPGAPTTGYMAFGNAGHFVGFDGTNLLADGSLIKTAANTAEPPLGAMVAFRTLAELTAAGARWARETAADGRMLIGDGTAAGIAGTFAANTTYGTTWAPLVAMGFGVTAGNLAVAAGAGGTGVADATHVFLASPTGATTTVSTAGHNHPGDTPTLSGAPGMTNPTAAYFPPMLGVVWGRRVS